MQIVCKCGFEHKDKNHVRTIREPIKGHRRLFCNICGRQLHIPTLRGTEFKRKIRSR